MSDGLLKLGIAVYFDINLPLIIAFMKKSL